MFSAEREVTFKKKESNSQTFEVRVYKWPCISLPPLPSSPFLKDMFWVPIFSVLTAVGLTWQTVTSPKECRWLILEICIPVLWSESQKSPPQPSIPPPSTPSSSLSCRCLSPFPHPSSCQERLGQVSFYKLRLFKGHNIHWKVTVAFERGGQVGRALAAENRGA